MRVLCEVSCARFNIYSSKICCAWIVVVLFVALGTASINGTIIEFQSRTAPAGVVNLAFPLEPGRYLVVNGGSNMSTNAHLETLNTELPRYRAWRGQSYGVDLVALDQFGLRTRGVQPADPRAYRIYGARAGAMRGSGGNAVRLALN